jgi:hypothetical protein
MRPRSRENAPARAGDFTEKASGSWLTGDRFFHCFTMSLTIFRRTLRFLFLRRVKSTTTVDAAELR